MKKLMKTIAFATVMCMLLSTAAFAAVTAPVDYDTKTLSISVTTEAAEGAAEEQVSLVVVKKGTSIATGNILYVGQEESVNGTASFTATITDTTVEAVDIYAGNATYATAKQEAQFLGSIELEEKITVATVAVVGDPVIVDDRQGADHTGAGVGMTFTITVPDNVNAQKMIWAITAGGKRYYTDSIDVTGLSGEVELGASFINGSIKNNIPNVEITDVDAIFLFSNTQEVYTDEATDKPNKAN